MPLEVQSQVDGHICLGSPKIDCFHESLVVVFTAGTFHVPKPTQESNNMLPLEDAVAVKDCDFGSDSDILNDPYSSPVWLTEKQGSASELAETKSGLFPPIGKVAKLVGGVRG